MSVSCWCIALRFWRTSTQMNQQEPQLSLLAFKFPFLQCHEDAFSLEVYPYCEKWALNWTWRKHLIMKDSSALQVVPVLSWSFTICDGRVGLQELKSMAVDIITLQEAQGWGSRRACRCHGFTALKCNRSQSEGSERCIRRMVQAKKSDFAAEDQELSKN